MPVRVHAPLASAFLFSFVTVLACHTYIIKQGSQLGPLKDHRSEDTGLQNWAGESDGPKRRLLQFGDRDQPFDRQSDPIRDPTANADTIEGQNLRARRRAETRSAAGGTEVLTWSVHESDLKVVRLASEEGLLCHRTGEESVCPGIAGCGPRFPRLFSCISGSDVSDPNPPVPLEPSEACKAGHRLQPNATLEDECSDLPEGSSSTEGWKGRVMFLNDVFLSKEGKVFNRSHLFTANGRCSGKEAQFSYPFGTKIVRRQMLVNLLMPPGGDVSSRTPSCPSCSLTHHLLPLAFLLSPLWPTLKAVPVVLQHLKAYRKHLQPLVGIHFVGPRNTVEEFGEDTLFHVQTLVQPLLPPCLTPSPSLWRRLRSSHLLPSSGLPIFDPFSGRIREVPDAPPPGAPLLPSNLGRDEWVAVLVRPRDADRKFPQFLWLERQMREAFGARLFVYGPTHLPHNEAKSLFNRAVLLVSLATSSALSNLIYLPFNSSVLELHPSRLDRRPPSPSDPGFWTRSLSRAAGLHHELLVCTAKISEGVYQGVRRRRLLEIHERPDAEESAPTSVFCDETKLLMLLQKAHQRVFTSPGLLDLSSPGPGAAQSGDQQSGSKAASSAAVGAAAADGTGDGIPLTPVAAGPLFERTNVENFDTWMRCIVEHGRWELDPTPRILPWLSSGTLSRCDIKRRSKGHLTGWQADAQVLAGVSPEEWDASPDVKWEWRVDQEQCGPWEEFSTDRLCRQVASLPVNPQRRQGQDRRLVIVFLGDSMTHNFVESFTGLLARDARLPFLKRGPPYPAWAQAWAINKTVTEECAAWPPQEHHDPCRQYVLMPGVCPGLEIHFLRNDRLLLDASPLGRHDRMPWAAYEPLQEADVVVLNTGAHPVTDETHERNVAGALSYLRYHYPDKLIIYRNTPPGHARCEDYDRPLDKPQDPSELPVSWGWARFAGQNRRAKKLVDRVGGLYMDVEYMTALRPEGHNEFFAEYNITDCLHYCVPGPVGVWSQLLYNILRRHLVNSKLPE